MGPINYFREYQRSLKFSPWTYAVAADFVDCQFSSNLLHKATNSPLRSDVSAASLRCHRFVTSDRGNADNVAARSLLDHMCCTKLNCREDSVQLGEVSMSKTLKRYMAGCLTLMSIVSVRSWGLCSINGLSLMIPAAGTLRNM